MYHIFFSHLSVNGHLDCFHVLAIVNSASVTSRVHISVCVCVCVCVCVLAVWHVGSNLAPCSGSVDNQKYLHMSFDLWFCSDICPGVRLLDHMATLFLVFYGTFILFSIVAAPTCISTHSVGGFPFLLTLSSVYYLWTF